MLRDSQKEFTPLNSVKRNSTGFTLVELLIVVALIAILATIGTFGYQNIQARARDSKRIADLDTVKNYIQEYYNQFQYYPDVVANSDTGYQAGTNWVGLTDKLKQAGIVDVLPNDPLFKKTGQTSEYHSYNYFISIDLQMYAINAYLETKSKALDGDIDNDDYDYYAFAPFNVGYPPDCSWEYNESQNNPSGYRYCVGDI